jgi:alpha-mannosidase
MTEYLPYTKHHFPYLLQMIGQNIYTKVGELEITAWRTKEPVSFEARQAGLMLKLSVGDQWGELFDCAWFHFSGEVPASAENKNVVLLIDVDGEMCVFDPAGVPIRGLTTVASEFDQSLGTPGKRVLYLYENASPGERIDVWADAGCNDLFGRLQNNGTVKEASIAVLNLEIRDLYYDFEVLVDSLQALPENSPRAAKISAALHNATHILWDGFSTKTIDEARQALAGELNRQNGDTALMISAIGHAHIDLGWLWPIRETHRKGARTFATALANMELYPDFRFAASQAQLFQWLKEDYPALYEKVRSKILDRRIEPQGALWVECDTNLTSGESLIRQIIYGKQFFTEEFGIDPDFVWLPDTFGYSAALPQIIARSGMGYFSTQKLSWSLINKFPYHSFHWQGLDGSRILVHMLPEETYNSPAAPRSVGKIEHNYAQKDLSHHALMVYGIGDGGGGPGEEHLERLTRLANFAGLSPVKQEWTSDFFAKLSKEADRFPTWVGELYLERHQGTLTTNARNKRYNRLMEQTLRELEFTASFAKFMVDAPYPDARLEDIWKEVLLYQFHDILPGSSIKRVYDESLARYKLLSAEAKQLLADAQKALIIEIDTSDKRNPVVIFNSLNWPRQEWVKLDNQWQQADVPAMGFSTIESDHAVIESLPTLIAENELLENDLIRIRFSPRGEIVSIFDKNNLREIIFPGETANRLLVFRDYGDAWDIPMDYTYSHPTQMQLERVKAWIDGPRAIVEQVYRSGQSTLVQQIDLELNSYRIEFSTNVSWRETGTMLRTRFPVNIFNNEATFEVQFGHVVRPTHTNTTWDLAMDEVPAQKWVDLSQGDYGVALMNDSKYGHRIKGHTIELNLLRSVLYPGTRVVFDTDVEPGEPNDAYTDQCQHTFKYALLPHQGDLMHSRVIRSAYEFNYPLQCCPTTSHPGKLHSEQSLFEIDTPNIIIETIKQAEDNQGIIVRLYESQKMETKARIRVNLSYQAVEETNLLEIKEREIPVLDDQIDLMFHPFEVKTIRIR